MAERIKLHIRKGDTVKVIAGREKGKTGKVLKVNPDKQKVIVEKINFVKRHSRPTAKAPQGGIIEREGLIHASKLNIVCAKCNDAVRIRKKTFEDGKRARTCAKCGEILDR